MRRSTPDREAGSVNRVLAAIDAGLQSSDEWGFGTDRDLGRCARCQDHQPADGDICAGCRAFLLGDSDDDPAADDRTTRELSIVISIDFEQAVEGIRRAADAIVAEFGDAFADLDEWKPLGVVVLEPENRVARDRREERTMLGRLRRSQRRTNRLGPRPGR